MRSSFFWIIYIICVLILGGLGNWQWDRLKEKEAQIVTFEANVKHPSSALPSDIENYKNFFII